MERHNEEESVSEAVTEELSVDEKKVSTGVPKRQMELEEQGGTSDSDSFDIWRSSSSDEDSESTCVYDCRCPRCIEIWEKRHYPLFEARSSPRRMSYMKFKDDLRKCIGVKFDFSPKQVLELEEVQAIQSELSEKDKLLCVQEHLFKLFWHQKYHNLNAYCNFLLDNNINVELAKPLSELEREHLELEHQRLFPKLSHVDICVGIDRYMGNIPNSKAGHVLSEASKENIKKVFEEYLSQDLRRADEVPDPLDRMLRD